MKDPKLENRLFCKFCSAWQDDDHAKRVHRLGRNEGYCRRWARKTPAYMCCETCDFDEEKWAAVTEIRF